jgi:hypothetical protein
MAGSARGLFRATGNVAKAEVPRERDDFYPTPPEPTRALLHAEAERLRDFPAIWEPAVGDGAMRREIEAAGWVVLGSDLVQRGAADHVGDFFAFDAAPARAMITNPPYQEVNFRDGRGRWVEHAMGPLGLDYMALLLSWSWPGAGGLGPLWLRWPPARVYLMRWRIDWTGDKAPPAYHGWFVWDRAWGGETVLRMLDRGAGRPAGGPAVTPTGPCGICGAPVAPFGYGWPGFRRDLPEGRRGILRVCPACVPAAEARREAALGALAPAFAGVTDGGAEAPSPAQAGMLL